MNSNTNSTTKTGKRFTQEACTCHRWCSILIPAPRYDRELLELKLSCLPSANGEWRRSRPLSDEYTHKWIRQGSVILSIDVRWESSAWNGIFQRGCGKSMTDFHATFPLPHPYPSSPPSHMKYQMTSSCVMHSTICSDTLVNISTDYCRSIRNEFVFSYCRWNRESWPLPCRLPAKSVNLSSRSTSGFGLM